MDLEQILLFISANSVDILSILAAVHFIASTLSQWTTNEKINTFASRLGSVIDLLSGAVGKATPEYIPPNFDKPSPRKDALRLLRHVATGKFQ